MSKAFLVLAGAGVAAATATALPGISAAEDELPAWQQATITGEAQSCVPLRQIRETKVHDDRTIDFHMRGGQVYRNTLPVPCGGLGFEERFSYSTSVGQLCSSDIITVIRQPIDLEGPRCGLGQFVPVDIPES